MYFCNFSRIRYTYNNNLRFRIQAKSQCFANIYRVFRFIGSIANIFFQINTHKTYESLFEHVPREYLPSNYGGTEKAIEELYGK